MEHVLVVARGGDATEVLGDGVVGDGKGMGRNVDFSLEIETEMLKLEIDSLTHTLSRARELKSEV